MSLQRRVAVALAGIVALFVTALGLLAYLSVQEQEDALVDEIVASEARRLATHVAHGERPHDHHEAFGTPAPGLAAWLVEPDGRALPGPLPGRLRGLPDGVHRLTEPGREHLHAAVLSGPQGRVVVEYDAARNEAKVDEFGLLLAGLAGLCIALGAALAWQVARVVVAPIERLTARLEAWAPAAGVAPPAGSDEESRLLDAFARVQARLEQAMAHEREFVANVGHEIRTPLAALRTDLELLQLGTGTTAARDARLARAMGAVDTIAAALTAAQAVRQRAPVAPQITTLAGCIDDAWASLGALPQQRGLHLVNAVAPDANVLADRHALLTVLRNLLRNAAEHAGASTCTVRGDVHGLEVADDGAGIAPADLPRVFDRYWSGRLADSPDATPGAVGAADAVPRGLGLAIAKQVADLNGWHLSVRSAPGEGTCFALRLGAPETATPPARRRRPRLA